MTLADVAFPADAGKRLRAASMVQALAPRCELHVVVLFADADPSLRPLPPGVQASWHVVPPNLLPQARAAAEAVVRRLPWQVAVQDWSGARRSLSARDGAYDLVWFGALDHFARLRGTVRAERVIVDVDDVETEKLARALSLSSSPALPRLDRLQRRIELPLWGRLQREVVRGADAVLVCSELDRQRLALQAAPGDGAAAARIVSVPNTYTDPGSVPPRNPEGSCTVVVVANYGTDQNLDAATFAVHEVLPALRAAVPGARLRLVGRRPDRLAALVGAEGLDVVGCVESDAEELSRAHAVLVPIRFGGGTRLKILEALAYRVPIVSTTAGAEGIAAVPGEHLLIGDSPDEIVAAVRRLLVEGGLEQRLTAAGRRLYESRYQPSAAAATVAATLTRVLAKR